MANLRASEVKFLHVYGNNSIKKHDKPKKRWKNKHLVVEPEPGKIQTNLEIIVLSLFDSFILCHVIPCHQNIFLQARAAELCKNYSSEPTP